MLLQKCFKHINLLLRTALTAYQLEYSLQRRTPQNYVESIIKFVNDVLPNHRSMNEANRSANQVIQNTQINNATAATASNTNKVPNSQKSKTRTPTVSITLPPEFPPFWCWSHPNANSHWSYNCKYPKEGHQRMATKENPIGSKHP